MPGALIEFARGPGDEEGRGAGDEVGRTCQDEGDGSVEF